MWIRKAKMSQDMGEQPKLMTPHTINNKKNHLKEYSNEAE